MADALVSAKDVVTFWRDAGAERWFKKDAAFDAEIKQRFLPTYEAAAAGKLRDWENNAEGALALLILLDQFPRNMFRGDKRAFAADPLARAADQGLRRAGRRHARLLLSAVRTFGGHRRSGARPRALQSRGR
jgi:uncharacterized protein (DUF924 family)